MFYPSLIHARNLSLMVSMTMAWPAVDCTFFSLTPIYICDIVESSNHSRVGKTIVVLVSGVHGLHRQTQQDGKRNQSMKIPAQSSLGSYASSRCHLYFCSQPQSPEHRDVLFLLKVQRRSISCAISAIRALVIRFPVYFAWLCVHTQNFVDDTDITK